MTRDRRSRRDDEGSALILALAVITVVGLMLGAVLTFTETSLLSTPAFVENRNVLYDADAAVDNAINAVRGSQSMGSEGFGCGPFNQPAGRDGVVVTVECQSQPLSGSASDQVPPYAVLLMGAEGFVQAGNRRLTVDGGLYSNGRIDLTLNGSQNELQVFGDVFAELDCAPDNNLDPRLTTVGGRLECDYAPPASHTAGNDPDYPRHPVDLDTLAVDPEGTCGGVAGRVVTFVQGLYTEIPRAATGCTGAVWWFSPGDYYFDFPAARAEWVVDDQSGKTVVGGTPNGFTSTSLASTVPFPGACDKTAADGVQFIVGGPTQITTNTAGNVELCGSKDDSDVDGKQVIALYGLKDGVRTTETDKVFAETGVPLSPFNLPNESKYTDPNPLVGNLNAAKTIDGSFVNAPLTTSGGPNAKDLANIRLPEFADVPLGARIVEAELRVKHWAVGNVSAITPSIAIEPAALGTGTLSKYSLADCLLSNKNFCTDVIPLTVDGAFAYKDLNSLAATYASRITGNNAVGNSDNLDGVQLVVTYVPTGAEETTCTESGDNCALVTSTVAQKLFFHGTVYAPESFMDLTLHNKDTTIFDRGVILNSLKVTVSAGSKQEDSPFQLPEATTGREVLFIARVAGVEKLRALVKYEDFKTDAATGTTTAFPGYKVIVKKWSVLR